MGLGWGAQHLYTGGCRKPPTQAAGVLPLPHMVGLGNPNPVWPKSIQMNSPGGREQRPKPVRNGHEVGAGVSWLKRRRRPGGCWDTDGGEANRLDWIDGGCGEEVTVVAIGWSQETGEVIEAEPKAQTRVRGI